MHAEMKLENACVYGSANTSLGGFENLIMGIFDKNGSVT